MASLFFYYSSMNAGKSTTLLQSSHNYQERGMRTLILTPEVDDRFGQGIVRSRIGLEAKAVLFSKKEDLLQVAKTELETGALHCVLVDEAQFLTQDQVSQLCRVVDQLEIPVLAYGIRTDFQGELFEGSRHLLAWADNLVEIKTICHCGRKATMVVRLDADGKAVKEGTQIEIGGNDRYLSLCRRHFHEMRDAE
ncbi:MAG: thymidine kinase [Opitutae bacterium]|nr:thymidine kinase [Opitutae bacterium]MBT4223310.1 thymidine kinase [Opitutae bacterium]MBT5692174.1 thymidine kinase [Opitutae bacterium]MBT7852744.1 thymidine kinase [Opitutae bacterium]